MSVSERFFSLLEGIDTFYWSYIGFTLVVAFGFYFTFKTKFFQFRILGRLRRTVKDLKRTANNKGAGTNPIRLYFASVGGMVGLGNIVGVITALLYGGPGALFWLWVASFSGMLVKYSEVYLGVRFRLANDRGGYDGGPMYYIQKAFKNKYLPFIISGLLCIYGVEVYQFLVVTDALVYSFSMKREIVVATMLLAVLYTGFGGIKRLANVCTVMMPAFMIAYVLMCLWVIILNLPSLPALLFTVVKSAFTGHAAVGGFAGSTFILAAQYGIARAVYSGDIGIGYDATIQSETNNPYPEKQARMAIFSLLTDTIICSMSMLVVLITGLWTTPENVEPSQFVALSLAEYFPYAEYFMGVLLFLAGFTTIIAYFAVGIKSARFISPAIGSKLYYLYAIFAFIFFSFFDQSKVIIVMSISGGLLMLINLIAIYKLRDEIKFH